MKNIFSVLCYQREKRQDTVLSLIVREKGSSPRGSGSMMLVSRAGRLTGTIGGGALEYTAEKEALEMLSAGTPVALKAYDLTKNGALGMTCGGTVSVLYLLFRYADPEPGRLAEEVLRRIEAHEPGSLCFYTSGRLPSLTASEEEEPVLRLPLPIGERAIIFGGGHIAKDLCPLLTKVGFRVTVTDDRAEYANAERFPEAESVMAAPYENVCEALKIGPEDYIVIMTNGHAFDAFLEEQVLRVETAYVGVIGSRAKIAGVNQKLRAVGIPEEKLEAVHTPIGTPIKAVTPAEIAVSIAGEMILERALLREQKGETPSRGCPMH